MSYKEAGTIVIVLLMSLLSAYLVITRSTHQGPVKIIKVPVVVPNKKINTDSVCDHGNRIYSQGVVAYDETCQ